MKIKLSDNCNNKCLVCYRKNEDFDISLEKFLNLKIENKKGEAIEIVSREPSIDSKFIENILLIQSKFPDKKIKIISNGRFLFYSHFRKEIAELKNIEIKLLFFGHNKEIHDSFTQEKGSFEQVFYGTMAMLRKKDFKEKITIKAIVNEQNILFFDQYLSFLFKEFKDVKKIELSLKIDSEKTLYKNRSLSEAKMYSLFNVLLHKNELSLKKINFALLDIPYCRVSKDFWPQISFARKNNKFYTPKCNFCVKRKECSGFIFKETLKELRDIAPIKKIDESMPIRDFIFFKSFKDLFLSEKTTSSKYSFSTIVYKIKNQSSYSHKDILKAWKSGLKNLDTQKNFLNLYIHIPFCRARCNYCMHQSEANFLKKDIEIYLKQLYREINYYSNTFSNISFSSLYIGGGSPSMLEEGQIKKLLDTINKKFSFKIGAEKSFECNPSTTNAQKLKLIKTNGFTRISLGVQSFDKDVLKLANREYQTLESVESAIKNAEKNSLVINTDLLLGIAGENEGSVVKSFEKLIRMRPDTISLYPFLPDDNYLKNVLKLKPDEYYEILDKKIISFLEKSAIIAKVNNYSYPSKILLNEGYSVTFCNIEKERKKEKGAIKYFNTSAKAFILGLGSYSHSKLPGLNYENHSSSGRIFCEDNKVYSAIDFSGTDLMREYVLSHYSKQIPIDLLEFKKKFNKNFYKAFSQNMEIIKKEKVFYEKNGKIYFNISDKENMISRALLFFDSKEILKSSLI